MKRSLFFTLLTVVTCIVVGSPYGDRLWAKPSSNKNSKVLTAAKSFTGSMHPIKTNQWSGTSRGTAVNVSISFDLSKDKSNVTQISISIGKIKYEVETPDSTKTGIRSGAKIFINGPFPISNKVFQTRDEKDTIFVKGT